MKEQVFKNINRLAFIAIVICNLGCSNDNSSSKLQFQVGDPKEEVLLSDIVEKNVEYIIPDSSSMISRVRKVKVIDSLIFIFDRNLQKVIALNEQGRMICEISNRGKGPGEFVRIDDFCYNEKLGTINIYSIIQDKIYTYNLKGNFINETEIDGNYDAIEYVDGMFVFFNGVPYKDNKFFVTTYDIKDEHFKKYMEIPYTIEPGEDRTYALRHYFQKFKDELSLSIPGQSKIYTIENDTIGVKYNIHFGDNSKLHQGYYPTSFEQIRKQSKGNVSWIMGYYESEQFITISFIRNNSTEMILYSKISGNYINYSGGAIINDLNGFPVSIVSIYDNYLLTLVYPMVVEKKYNKGGLAINKIRDTEREKIMENENPIFVRYKIKDF